MRVSGALKRTGLGACVLFTALFCAVTFLPILGPWIGFLTAPWSGERADTLIVLAGDDNMGHILGLSSYWRTVYAVYEWRSGGCRSILFSGGDGIAETMRGFAVAHGVPPDAIRLETRSQTTREQALFVTALLRDTPGSKVLLTSDYHSHRAWLAFRKAGLGISARPFPDARKRAGRLEARWPVFIELLRETTKYFYYTWKRWI